jgi:non-ribosomal peptide synthetase component E (peptide arylation enzyme)
VEALTLAASRLTLYQLFQKRATTQAKAVALTDGDTTYTYVELHQRVCKLAGALQALGLRRGNAWPC